MLNKDELCCSKEKNNPLSCSNLVCWVPPSTPLGLERGKVLMHPWPRSNSGYILEASTAIQWEHYMFSMQPIWNTYHLKGLICRWAGKTGKDNAVVPSLACKWFLFYQANFIAFYFTGCQLAYPLNQSILRPVKVQECALLMRFFLIGRMYWTHWNLKKYVGFLKFRYKKQYLKVEFTE